MIRKVLVDNFTVLEIIFKQLSQIARSGQLNYIFCTWKLPKCHASFCMQRANGNFKSSFHLVYAY